MRILFCNFEYPPLGGGGGVVTAALAEDLAQRHSVTVLTSHGFDLPAEVEENGVRVVRVPVAMRRRMASASFTSMFSYMVNGRRYGARLVRDSAFDVINTHFVLPTGPVGDTLARLAGIPNVLTVHGGDLYDPSKLTSPHRHWLLRQWVRRLVLRADAVVGQSTNTLDNLRAHFAPDVPAELIPLGIKRPPQTVASRADLGFEDDQVILVTVGRLVARKAVDRLIDCLARLNDSRAVLVVIGSGPKLAEWRAYARARGVADRVRFPGFVDEQRKYEILSVADLYVSTSLHEGFGLVFLEAMACGLPVVCYDHGGQTDFLQSGVTGFLEHAGDLTAFTESCRRLVDDPGLRSTMAQANRGRVTEFFIPACAGRYERVFRETISRFGDRASELVKNV